MSELIELIIELVLGIFIIIFIDICCCCCIWRPFLQTLLGTKLSDTKNLTLWPDLNFTYYDDTDNLQINMLEMSIGLVDYRDEITDDLLLFYDYENKIVAVEIYCASESLHVFNVQGKPRFTINPIYDKDSDILKINLVNFTPSMIKFEKTEVEDIEVEVDNAGKIVGLLFYNASNRLLKNLSDEERVKREKEVTEERMAKLEEIRMNRMNQMKLLYPRLNV
ncbi:hypothetical protein C1645_855495, partial [Glomus cerebriforme]